MFLTYPSVSATTLRLFHFNPELPEKLLAIDYRIALDSKWRFYAIWGGIAIVVYVVGIPLGFYYILQKYKADIYDDTRESHQRAVERAGVTACFQNSFVFLTLCFQALFAIHTVRNAGIGVADLIIVS